MNFARPASHSPEATLAAGIDPKFSMNVATTSPKQAFNPPHLFPRLPLETPSSSGPVTPRVRSDHGGSGVEVDDPDPTVDRVSQPVTGLDVIMKDACAVKGAVV